jgi:CheY-like chemotaxis protein
MLSGWRLKPSSARNASEALQLAEEAEEPYRLVISDLGMPDMDGYALADRIKALQGYENTKIIILSSYCQANTTTGDSLSIDGYLTKPVGQPSLLTMIRNVLAPKKSDSTDDAIITERSTHEEKRLKILLAEDNEINQMVATNILKQAGHTYVIANNGQEALDKWQEEQFDLILMDIHMPIMDGFEATSLIRDAEKNLGSHIQIVALTANAIKGDAERCIAGGMDGYLSKPFTRAELLDTINGFAPIS